MKIIFTGPECSGKTSLVKEICDKMNFFEVSEIAREYLNMNNTYDEYDLFEIGLLQLWEEKILTTKHQNICCDTDLLTILIWQNEKYSKIDAFLLKKWIEAQPDIYFLCTPDIKWEYDIQRENPNDRERLFTVYEDFLNRYQKTYVVIKGSLSERIEQVMKNVQKLL